MIPVHSHHFFYPHLPLSWYQHAASEAHVRRLQGRLAIALLAGLVAGLGTFFFVQKEPLEEMSGVLGVLGVKTMSKRSFFFS